MTTKEILKKVRRVELRTRQVVNTVLSGEYHSAFKGQGMEFAEVREYLPGDDVRTIDWNVTARMGHPFVKVFEEERELTVMLMVDASSSGEFGSVEQTKSEIAVEVCALLAFSAIKNSDRVGLIIFTDKVEQYIPPKKGRKHVLRVVRELLMQFDGLKRLPDQPVRGGDEASSTRPTRSHPLLGAVATVATLAASAAVIARLGAPASAATWSAVGAVSLAGLALAGLTAWGSLRGSDVGRGRGTDIAQALDFLNRVTTRRGIAFVISDFQATEFEQPLRAANRRHDLVAISITDPREVTLAGAGLLTLEDSETGEQLVVDSSDRQFRRLFERQAAGIHEERRRLFRSNGVDTIDVMTDESYIEPLTRFFTFRANRL